MAATVFLPRDPELSSNVPLGSMLRIQSMIAGVVVVSGNRVRSYADDHRKLDDQVFPTSRAAAAYGRRIAGAKVR